MARFFENKCKLCRREGMKLFIKGDRCHTDKCPIARKKTIRSKNIKLSDYGIQLREKQKIKRYYSVLEKQFRNYFEHASRQREGLTGENLLILLERRLDNVVFRMKLSRSRNQARQFVSHGMFKVNGKPVNIPSYLVKKEDIIELSLHGTKNNLLKEIIEVNQKEVPEVEWLTFDFSNKKGQVVREPQRKDVTMLFNEQLVVELYSK